jgi:DNA-binding MarR family transcriptional regulator
MDSAQVATRASARTEEVLAWLRLMRIHQRVNNASARRLRPLGLSLGQFDVLAHLGNRPPTAQQSLARSLLVTKGNISQLLERLEDARWVRRCIEGRTKRLTLTRSGMRLRTRAVPVQEELVQECFACLSRQELATLTRLLGKLDRGMKRRRPSPEPGRHGRMS